MISKGKNQMNSKLIPRALASVVITAGLAFLVLQSGRLLTSVRDSGIIVRTVLA